MPYIIKDRRNNLDEFVDKLKLALEKQVNLKECVDITPEQLLEISGDINYCVSRLVSGISGNPSYKKIAIITGVLENIKQEFYRRLATSYENEKIVSNGDIEEYKNYST